MMMRYRSRVSRRECGLRLQYTNNNKQHKYTRKRIQSTYVWTRSCMSSYDVVTGVCERARCCNCDSVMWLCLSLSWHCLHLISPFNSHLYRLLHQCLHDSHWCDILITCYRKWRNLENKSNIHQHTHTYHVYTCNC